MSNAHVDLSTVRIEENRKLFFLIAIAFFAVITMVYCRYFEFHIPAIASKMTASSAFVAVAITSGAFKTQYGRIVLAALLLSWIGDFLLTGRSERMFLFGLGSFLLAHIAYVKAFWARGISRSWAINSAIPIVLVSTGVTIWLTPYVPTDFVVAVRVYTLVISLMVIAAFGARGFGAPILVPTGALLFYFSDLSVATGQFVQPDFPNYVWGLPFYFCGQILLALSVRAPSITTGSGR